MKNATGHGLIFALIVLYALCVFSACAPNENRYALTAQVVELDFDSDVVTCVDCNGNLWEFYGCEDWQIGDCVALLMNDNGTEKIFDDKIEKALYNAWDLSK